MKLNYHNMNSLCKQRDENESGDLSIFRNTDQMFRPKKPKVKVRPATANRTL